MNAVAATTAPTAKKSTKMAIGRALFQEIFAKGYKLKNGNTQRGEFIERAMDEHKFSKHCAGTYYQNLSNESAGKPLYLYNKNKPKTKAEVKEMEAQLLALTHQAKERWMVVNEEGVEVNNFKTRGDAQKFAKDNGLSWKDRSKAA